MIKSVVTLKKRFGKKAMIGFALMICSLAGNTQEVKKFTLKEAQDFAVTNSYDSRMSEMDVESAKKRVKEVTAIGLPQINSSLSYQNYIKQPVTLIPADFSGGDPGTFQAVVFGTEQNMTADITASQLIFDGSYIIGLKAAKTYLELSENSRLKTETEIRNAIAKAYYMVLTAEENLKILKENAKTTEQVYTETKALYENGFLEEQDADQAQLNKMASENSIANAERQVKISRNLLKFQMGIPIEEAVELRDEIEPLIQQSNQPSYLLNKFSLENHIDYKIVLTNYKAGELTLKNERTGYLPTLNGFITHQQNAPTNEFNFLSDANWYPATFWGLNLSLPIFSSFMKHNKVQQAKIALDKLDIQKTMVGDQLKVQVENAKSNYAFALDNYSTTKGNLELAQKIKDKTNIKYKEGISSSLELTQVESQYLNMQSKYIQALLDLLNRKSELDKALNNY